ncbi:CYFA0S04e03488g1_1 [Cyberlindnera fabianii]|uniref:Mediator of RNA polymerase II transcription subunit 7 n=1 Tax=Cyberlindnera fabianii TaxID=36022 RepID=A0A061ASF6_CYBFA|nr:Mediator of RNA polymerase II transcription subunit 7 [Cyberlindnera fabianii]CDR40095.1 CYFA0S04e03488g1_1 [Cyberlindnera fabianii]
MSEDTLISSLYPPPPPYVKFFTSENLDKLQQLRDANPGQPDTSLSIPQEESHLEFLIPPTQPTGETYRSFGSLWNFADKIPKLEDQGIPQLYRDVALQGGEDSQFKIDELKKLLKSLLLNFLEVTGVMGIAPHEFSTKLEHIRTLLINIHHLLNEYRPHQSRESLILLLENQIETKKNEITEIEKTCKEVEDKVKALVEQYVDGKTPKETDDQEAANDETRLTEEPVGDGRVTETA